MFKFFKLATRKKKINKALSFKDIKSILNNFSISLMNYTYHLRKNETNSPQCSEKDRGRENISFSELSVVRKTDWPLKFMNVTLFWRSAFEDVIIFKDLEIISSWIRVDFKSDSSVLRREGRERTKTKTWKWMQNYVSPNHDINRFRVQG